FAFVPLAAHLGDPLWRVHRAAAVRAATRTGRRCLIIVKVVVPDQFFSSGNVAERKNPDPVLDLIDFAIGITGVIEVSAHTFAVNHRLAVFQPIQIGSRSAIVQAIRLFGRHTPASVFHNPASLPNGSGSEDPDGMNARRADYESHKTNFARRRGFGESERILQVAIEPRRFPKAQRRRLDRDGGTIPVVRSYLRI